jgi:hypothetical protein
MSPDGKASPVRVTPFDELVAHSRRARQADRARST